MTSQDKAIAYIVRTSGITSPTMLAQLLDIPVETARSWMRRIRKNGFNPTGEIRPEGSIPPVQSHQEGSIPPVPRARTSYTGIINNPPLSPKDEMAAALTGNAAEKVICTDDHRILITCAAERSDWLVKFGSAERLDQALLQAAGYVQPNNRAKPLLAQVRAQLAQQLARRMDQDARYQSSKTKQSEDPGKAWLLRDVPRPDVANREIEGNYV